MNIVGYDWINNVDKRTNQQDECTESSSDEQSEDDSHFMSIEVKRVNRGKHEPRYGTVEFVNRDKNESSDGSTEFVNRDKNESSDGTTEFVKRHKNEASDGTTEFVKRHKNEASDGTTEFVKRHKNESSDGTTEFVKRHKNEASDGTTEFVKRHKNEASDGTTEFVKRHKNEASDGTTEFVKRHKNEASDGTTDFVNRDKNEAGDGTTDFVNRGKTVASDGTTDFVNRGKNVASDRTAEEEGPKKTAEQNKRRKGKGRKDSKDRTGTGRTDYYFYSTRELNERREMLKRLKARYSCDTIYFNKKTREKIKSLRYFPSGEGGTDNGEQANLLIAAQSENDKELERIKKNIDDDFLIWLDIDEYDVMVNNDIDYNADDMDVFKQINTNLQRIQETAYTNESNNMNNEMLYGSEEKLMFLKRKLSQRRSLTVVPNDNAGDDSNNAGDDSNNAAEPPALELQEAGLSQQPTAPVLSERTKSYRLPKFISHAKATEITSRKIDIMEPPKIKLRREGNLWMRLRNYNRAKTAQASSVPTFHPPAENHFCVRETPWDTKELKAEFLHRHTACVDPADEINRLKRLLADEKEKLRDETEFGREAMVHITRMSGTIVDLKKELLDVCGGPSLPPKSGNLWKAAQKKSDNSRTCINDEHLPMSEHMELTSEIMQLQRELDKSQEENADLKAKTMHLTEDVDNLRSMNTILEDRIELDKQKLLEDIKDRVDDTLTTDGRLLKALKYKYPMMADQLCVEKLISQELRSELERREIQLNSMKGQNQEYHSSSTLLCKQIDQVKEEKTFLDKEYNSLQARFKEGEKDAVHTKELYALKIKRLIFYQTRTELDMEYLEKENQIASAEIKKLQTQLKAKEARLKAYNLALKEFRHTHMLKNVEL